MQVDEDNPGYYRQGDCIAIHEPFRFTANGSTGGRKMIVLLDGKCKRLEVAKSRNYWAINKDGGYLYANHDPKPYP